MLRDRDQVGMRYAETMHHHPHPLWVEHLAHPSANLLSNHHYVLSCSIRNVREVVNVLLRNHETFSWVNRSDTHERHEPVILIDNAGGLLVIDNPAEDTGHNL